MDAPPKFKNIPALNGHMRLHGGYYKKDADGRRLVGMANTSPLKTVGLSSTAQQSPTESNTNYISNSPQCKNLYKSCHKRYLREVSCIFVEIS